MSNFEIYCYSSQKDNSDFISIEGGINMPELIYKTEEMSVIEQTKEFLNELTEQQQREFMLMIQGAQLTMQLVKKQEQQTA